MVKGVAFIGYPVEDMARARKFYEEVFDLKVETEFGEEYVEYAIGDGTTLALGKMDDWKPSPDGPSVAFEVEDFDAMMARLKEHNVKIATEPMDFPNCRMCIVVDSEGNQVVVHKLK